MHAGAACNQCVWLCARHSRACVWRCARACTRGQVGKTVSKHFSGHGTFSGSVTYYAPKSDTFRVVYSGALDTPPPPRAAFCSPCTRALHASPPPPPPPSPPTVSPLLPLPVAWPLSCRFLRRSAKPTISRAERTLCGCALAHFLWTPALMQICAYTCVHGWLCCADGDDEVLTYEDMKRIATKGGSPAPRCACFRDFVFWQGPLQPMRILSMSAFLYTHTHTHTHTHTIVS